ncbi:protein-L-isoaspartate O-methyltransferase family protein [Corynebacterium lubricantis]|uniref:protein-L-isoaspartate O-methyltransferase family protein n=1 Tax=Corynebacterium lubricantis TaxID=541095 RepID=UPI00038177CF|nr:methyltransferase domain-containing protein [Corynebacterium lubricantis]
MERIEQAMLAVPRADFLPPEYAEHAHIDAPLAIGHDQTNSQPTTVEIMLMLLGPRPGNKVLDVGSGSGWTTALLSELVGEKGYVWGVELVPDLVRMGQNNLKASGAKSAEIRQAHRRKLGLAEESPFDRILVSAEAKEIPAELVKQLAPGGTMVIPVAGTMHRLCLDVYGHATVSTHGQFRFVPLV